MADDIESKQSLMGTRLSNRYEIRSEIGRGGMGVVYYGYDTLLQRAVAIKVLPAALTYDRQFVERFRQEAVSAAGLHHAGIVTIHDVGEAVLAEQGQQRVYFIVMQYLEGTTLDVLLQGRGPLTLQQANHLVRQVGDALDYAHSHGMIHRDIKPSNIMVGPDGHATILDFGLVRAGEGVGLTRTGMVVGTPEYMAPEQALGETVDARTDIYSFGVVAYRMLSGQVPFTRSNSMATAYAHVHDTPPSLRQTRPDLPKPVEAVVFKALAKAPAERYQRAGLLADDFALAVANKMPAGLKVAATTAAAVAPGGPALGNQAKSPLPRPAKTPKPSPAPAAAAADATQLVGSGAGGRVATPAAVTLPAPQRRRSLGLGAIGLVALLLVAVAAAAVLMLSGGNEATSPPNTAQGEGGQPAATAVVVAAPPSVTPTAETAAETAAMPTPTASSTATVSQQPATATPATSPTATGTQRPATATPTASPTATGTQRPATATPTASPTATPQSPTATPAQATATATPAPRPTATAAPPTLAVPALGAPSDGATTTGETAFSWQWSGPALANNQAFEVRLWKEGQPDHYGATGPVRSTNVTFNVAGAYGVQQGGSGRYYWTVAVVQTDPYQRIGQEAPPRSLNIELGGGGDNGGGGGGGAEPTPTPP